MLLRDLVLRRGCCWPSLLLHCALHPLWGFVQVSLEWTGREKELGALCASGSLSPAESPPPQNSELTVGVQCDSASRMGSWVCSCPQVTHAEPQRSCSKVTDSCQHICQCRPPPPLPPPPPPPPPPRLLSAPAPNSTSGPAEESWWSGLVIVIAVCCASLVFLTVLVIICYKAIKRKPLRKDENGTSTAEYPMSASRSGKAVDVNNAVV